MGDLAWRRIMASFLAKGGSLLHNPDIPSWAASSEDEVRGCARGLCCRSPNVRCHLPVGVQSKTASKPPKPINAPKYHIPGYTGFIPNSAEIAGRSYGRMTRRAMNKPVHELLVGDQIPPSPQATHKISCVPKQTVASMAEAAPRHVPGYTGFVPNTRES